MKYLFYDIILLLGIVLTYCSVSEISNQFCVSPNDEFLSCEPENSVLNQFLSARSVHSCSEETPQVSMHGINPNII